MKRIRTIVNSAAAVANPSQDKVWKLKGKAEAAHEAFMAHHVKHVGTPGANSAKAQELYDKAQRAEKAFKAALKAEHPKRNGPAFDAAAAASEEFHGTPAHEVFKVKTEIFEHSKLGDVGELIQLEIKPVDGGRIVDLSGFEGARLARSPKGYNDQLYIEGGDQAVDLEQFGIEDPHEFETLGVAHAVTYYTVKHHLSKKDGGEANYRHKFGDNGGVGPDVIYDVQNKLLSFSGGTYKIPAEGIDN